MRPLVRKAPKLGLFERIFFALRHNKRRIIIIAGLTTVLYYSKKSGYLSKVLSRMLSMVETRMQKTLEENIKKMQEVNKKTSVFANFFNNFIERNTPIVSQYLKRFCDSTGINLTQSKQRLKVPTSDKNEKAAAWKGYKDSVIKACLLTLIAKGFLNLVWFIKDSLKLKYENVFS